MNRTAFQIYGSKKTGIFQSTWKTDNAGVSSSTQIELPLLSGGTYNFWIDWGDGSTTNVTSYSQRTHTYTSAGTYTLRATGTVGIWRFANGGDKLKILTISSWGKLILGVNTFYGCSNLTLSGVTDIPDLSTVTSFQATFFSCSKITTIGRINEWNTSTITSTIQMFHGCTLFNSNISNWNVSNITAFNQMFFTAGAFNNGYAYGIVNTLPWITTNAITFNQAFTGAVAFNSNISAFNVSKVTNFTQMFQNANSFNNGYASGVSNQLPWTINTTSSVDMSNLFAFALAFNSNLGTGTTPWDVSKVTSFASMFNGATKFTNGDDSAPINNWSINTVSNVVMNSMFQSAMVFDRPIESWNMTKVINTSSMFRGAIAFNQPLYNWERTGSTMGNNESMAAMFYDATAFDKPIGSWNVSNVTSMTSVFYNAISFNQPLDNWERVGSTTGNVTDMNGMFRGATAFNGLVDTWNVSKVTNMQAMFWNAPRFNKPLANWERVGSTLANVTLFSSNNIYVGMFGLATDFNQPIGNWNVSKVTRMNYMFRNATNFNQSIDAWDVSSVWDMEGMFNNASSFNKPLGSWNLSKISNMASMFEGANTFNNGLAAGLSGTFTWNINTISDINMSRMFPNLGVFNQNIGAWNVSKVTNFTNFMLGKTPSTYSSTNLDAIYNGWIVNGVKPNINISFGTAKHTAAGTAGRLTLTSAPNNWIIQDGGL